MSNAPRYQKLKNHILDGIQSRQWHVDEQVPSENALSATFSVSRMTARRALRELTEEGKLYRVQGLGTFVAEQRPDISLVEIRDISEEIRLRGHHYTNAVVEVMAIPANASISHYMEIPVHKTVYHSVIVHMENGTPVQLEERFVNPESAKGYLDVDFAKTTANAFLCAVAPLSRAEHSVEAVMPDAEARNLLVIPEDEPCLLIRRRTWSGEVLVCYARLTHPGSRYRMTGTFTT